MATFPNNSVWVVSVVNCFMFLNVIHVIVVIIVISLYLYLSYLNSMCLSLQFSCGLSFNYVCREADVDGCYPEKAFAFDVDVVEMYVDLMCQYRPDDVCKFIKGNDCYRLDEALKVFCLLFYVIFTAFYGIINCFIMWALHRSDVDYTV